MSKYASFEEWMGGATVYIVHDRYGEYSPHGFVAVSGYSEDDKLREAVEDLQGGDNDMMTARDYLNALETSGKLWIGVGALPSEACANLETKMREAQQRIISEFETAKK